MTPVEIRQTDTRGRWRLKVRFDRAHDEAGEGRVSGSPARSAAAGAVGESTTHWHTAHDATDSSGWAAGAASQRRLRWLDAHTQGTHATHQRVRTAADTLRDFVPLRDFLKHEVNQLCETVRDSEAAAHKERERRVQLEKDLQNKSYIAAARPRCTKQRSKRKAKREAQLRLEAESRLHEVQEAHAQRSAGRTNARTAQQQMAWNGRRALRGEAQCHAIAEGNRPAFASSTCKSRASMGGRAHKTQRDRGLLQMAEDANCNAAQLWRQLSIAQIRTSSMSASCERQKNATRNRKMRCLSAPRKCGRQYDSARAATRREARTRAAGGPSTSANARRRDAHAPAEMQSVILNEKLSMSVSFA